MLPWYAWVSVAVLATSGGYIGMALVVAFIADLSRMRQLRRERRELLHSGVDMADTVGDATVAAVINERVDDWSVDALTAEARAALFRGLSTSSAIRAGSSYGRSVIDDWSISTYRRLQLLENFARTPRTEPNPFLEAWRADQDQGRAENAFFSDELIRRATRQEVEMSWVFFAWRPGADLRYSIQEIEPPNRYYDFADKTFKEKPTCPRAALLTLTELQGGLVVYQGAIGPRPGIVGEYQVVVRDMAAPANIVAMMRVNFLPGMAWSAPPGQRALMATERGLPPLMLPAPARVDRSRGIEVEDS